MTHKLRSIHIETLENIEMLMYVIRSKKLYAGMGNVCNIILYNRSTLCYYIFYYVQCVSYMSDIIIIYFSSIVKRNILKNVILPSILEFDTT